MFQNSLFFAHFDSAQLPILTSCRGSGVASNDERTSSDFQAEGHRDGECRPEHRRRTVGDRRTSTHPGVARCQTFDSALCNPRSSVVLFRHTAGYPHLRVKSLSGVLCPDTSVSGKLRRPFLLPCQLSWAIPFRAFVDMFYSCPLVGVLDKGEPGGIGHKLVAQLRTHQRTHRVC